ncbi:hypothetical protein Y032_0764g2153 [Ancylostoma ceylanicum]|uniref:Uncharacterized protein n=1 Tax=Ancylostoma ceylanicum TaxID=53326 RepID=A0A016WFM3_9BILA|nr:hypothetical protein Y032_0764g2153 [Ancylostoma ceylanicum]
MDRICFTYGDDLIWRDPNEISKKFERDSGVALWGDPEIAIRNWLVGEGEDEDLETALASRPASPDDDEEAKSTDHERGDFVRELPSVFPRPAVKKIVPTGWVELPSRDNPCSQRQASTRVVSCPSPGSADIFEFLGQHSEYFTQHNRLSPSVAQFIGHFHALIPRLRAVEMDLKHIVDQVKSGIITEEQIAHYMSQSEKVEYDRLVLGLAGLRVEMANLLRRMQSNTRATDAGNDRVALQDPPIYDFPFSL